MSTVEQVPEVDIARADELLKEGKTTFLDVRDPDSFSKAHIPEAKHLTNATTQEFLESADKERQVVVYCYHGNSSLGAAAFLMEQGFQQVWSMTGGFEAWRGAGKQTAKLDLPQQATVGLSKPSGGAGGSHFTITDLAKTKLDEFLKAEPEGTAVRITLEPSGGFGMALDVQQPGDIALELQGLPFVLERKVAPMALGLEIDFQAEGRAGFKLSGGSAPKAPGKDELVDDVKQRIADNKVMIFLKGTAASPMCGFSARAVAALQSTGKPFGDQNVFSFPEYRYAVSQVSSWPTIPQIFIDGEFVGGCDIVLEMQASGELQKKVDAAFSS